MLSTFRFGLIIALLCVARLWAGEADGPDAPSIAIEENRVYRKVNGENITGKDVTDLLLEESWDRVLQDFIDYTISVDEVKAKKIEVTDAETDVEVQALLMKFAEKYHIAPGTLKMEDLAKQVGLLSGLSTLHKRTKVSLGLLKMWQAAGKLAPTVHTWERPFKELVGDLLDKRTSQNGIEKDAKKLGQGEAVRIGVHSYNRDEVRAFGIDQVSQVTLNELKKKLDILTFDRVAQNQLKVKGLELKDDDLEFHFSYACRKAEAATGVPGRMAMQQQLQQRNMTPEQFMHSRIFRADAVLTLLAKTPIKGKMLKDEFESHPDKYKRSENLVAHIFIRVLDPDGRGYTPAWKAPGHDALNDYVARRREEQFAAAKPKMEQLVAEAKRDFEAVAKKYSDDNRTKVVGGKIGRIGESTILMPPCDATVRDAAVKLKPGDISEPVRSAYGWHLLKCLEQQDVTFDEAAERVYMNLIHDNKLKMQDTLLNGAKIEDSFDGRTK